MYQKKPFILSLTPRQLTNVIVLICLITLALAERVSAETSVEHKRLQSVWEEAGYAFTPQVKKAFIASQKSEALAELESQGISLPDDFLEWIDSDPIVEATVYGVRRMPANMLRILRSLEIDLGKETTRKKYTQLVLAYAVKYAHEADTMNVAERPPLKLVIPEKHFAPVITKDAHRKLDLNDHVINFLNDNTINDEITVTSADEKSKTKENRSRTLVGGDVAKDFTLYCKMINYLKDKGFDQEIDLDEDRTKNSFARSAYELIRPAYEAKGYLPPKRDPNCSIAEAIAFLIRNYEFRFPESDERAKTWPPYPLDTSPWMALSMLADCREPLREMEDVWQRYVKEGKAVAGKFRYTGKSAQSGGDQPRGLAPFDFGYPSVQMMDKDGGVCGTSSGIGARTGCILGRPSSTTSFPSHCGCVAWHYDRADNRWAFTSWGGRPMSVYPFSKSFFRTSGAHFGVLAGGVNHSPQKLLDNNLAYSFFKSLNKDDKIKHGYPLLYSAVELSPFHYLTSLEVGKLPATQQLSILKHVQKQLKAIYSDAENKELTFTLLIFEQAFTAALMKQALPTAASDQKDIYTYLCAMKLTVDPRVKQRYQFVVEGPSQVLSEVEAVIQSFVAEDPLKRDNKRHILSSKLKQDIPSAANLFEDEKERVIWLRKVRSMIEDHVTMARVYRRRTKRTWIPYDVGRVTFDPLLATVNRLAGDPSPSDHELLDQVIRKDKQALADLLKHSVPLTAKQINAIQLKIRESSYLVGDERQDINQRSLWAKHIWQLAKSVHPDRFTLDIQRLDRLRWSIHEASSNKQTAIHAIDSLPSGNLAWTTAIAEGQTSFQPQFLSVDMNEVRELSGLTYNPRFNRKVPYWQGRVTGYQVFTSLDGVKWDLVAEGDWNFLEEKSNAVDLEGKTVTFEPTLARYFKFVVTKVHKDNPPEKAFASVQNLHVISPSLDRIDAEQALERYLQTKQLCDAQELDIDKIYPIQDLLYSLEYAPAPTGPTELQAIADFLDSQRRVGSGTKMRYRILIEGEQALKDEINQAVESHLASTRTTPTCNALASQVRDVARWITSAEEKRVWQEKLHAKFTGKESFPVVAGSYIGTDTVARNLATALERPFPNRAELCRKPLAFFKDQLQQSVDKPFTIEQAKQWQQEVLNVISKMYRFQINDDQQVAEWKNDILAIYREHREFEPYTDSLRKFGWHTTGPNPYRYHRTPSRNISDNNLLTKWVGKPGERNKCEIVVDMRGPQNITGFKYLGSTVISTFASNVEFYTSNDGRTWKLVADEFFEFSPEVIEFRVTPHSARYFKLRILDLAKHSEEDSGVVEVREVDIMDSDAASEESEITHDKVTTLQSTGQK